MTRTKLACEAATVTVSKRGFTLVELLVVIAIIGVLVALLLPAVQAAREAARRAQCTNNLKNVGIGLHNYADSKGTMPGGSTYQTSEVGNWVTELLPYVEEQDTAELAIAALEILKPSPGASADSPEVQRLGEVVLPLFICPSDPRSGSPIKRTGVAGQPDEIRFNIAGTNNPPVSQALWYTASMGPTIPDQCAFDTSAAVCMGCDFGGEVPWTPLCAPCVTNPRVPCPDMSRGVGMFARWAEGVPLRRVTDGLSHTIAVGETLPFDCIWNCLFCDNHPVTSTQIPINNREADEPAANLLRPWRSHGYKSEHPGGVNVLMGDGSVQFLQETIDYFVYNAMGTRAAGDISSR